MTETTSSPAAGAESEEQPLLDPAVIAAMFQFDPFDQAFHSDPYAVYGKLRESARVTRSPAGVVCVLGHQEVSSVLRDPRFGWGDGDPVADQFTPNPDGPPVRPLLFMDPPDHTRIRSLVTKAFSARIINEMRPTADALAGRLLAEAAERSGGEPVDLMSAVFGPLSALLLGSLMGVPDAYLEQFCAWADDSGRGLDPDFMLTPSQIARREAARGNIRDYFTSSVAERRTNRGTDLVSELVSAEEEGDRLTELELVTTCMTILGAGYGGTLHLIGNGLLALLRNPDQLAWLRANPEQVPAAVEELLRYDSPVQMIARIALEEADLGDGVVVNPGEQVFLLTGAANHDPEAYGDGDRLDLSRKTTRNLGFGLGIHFCLGAPLARITTQAALNAALRYDIRLAADEPAHLPGLVLRGLQELPVRLSRPAA
jgi:unspecific monooxygenase